jgi:uncharacterized coiled-coil protein SlyX
MNRDTITGLDLLHQVVGQQPTVEELEEQADALVTKLLDAITEAAEDGQLSATVAYDWSGRSDVVEKVRRRLEERLFVVRTTSQAGERRVSIEVSPHIQQITT